MAQRDAELAEGEWYHCYSRTIDKSRPFEHAAYARRFLETLYLANNISPMPNIPQLHASKAHVETFSFPRRQPLVAIGCYCLMPTHYHLLLQEVTEDGITNFMHKVGTGFTRFYNEQNDRIGNLFIKPFRSKHVGNDAYLGRVVQYIHLNPVELFEPQWKKGIIGNRADLEKQLRAYSYSSLQEHEGMKRPQSAILALDTLPFTRNRIIDIETMIAEAAEYYQFLEMEL